MWDNLVFLVNGIGTSRHNLISNKIYHPFGGVTTVLFLKYIILSGDVCRVSVGPNIGEVIPEAMAYWEGCINSLKTVLDLYVFLL